MATPDLRHAVQYHLASPIEVWDGATFTANPTLLNFSSRNQNREPTPFHFYQGSHLHPLGGLPTNILREVNNGQVWLTINHKVNSHRARNYATLYRGIRAQFKVKVIDLNIVSATRSSGLDYGVQIPDVHSTIATTYTNISAGRSGTLPRPFSGNGMSGGYTCYLDANLPIERGLQLDLDDGRSFSIKEIAKEDQEAYVCQLTLIGGT